MANLVIYYIFRKFEKAGEEEIPKLKLANEEFVKLYDILTKYNLINK